MSTLPFRRLSNHPNDGIAAQMAQTLCEEQQAARKGREEEPWDQGDKDRMEQLAALMIGRHAPVVVPIVTKYYPQMVQLLLRKAGVVESVPDLEQALPGVIMVGAIGYDWQHAHVRNGEMAIGAKVSFFPSDDGIATQIDVMDGTPA